MKIHTFPPMPQDSRSKEVAPQGHSGIIGDPIAVLEAKATDDVGDAKTHGLVCLTGQQISAELPLGWDRARMMMELKKRGWKTATLGATLCMTRAKTP